MGIVDLAQSNSRGILRYSEKADFDPYSMTAHAALALLEDLAANSAIVSVGPG